MDPVGYIMHLASRPRVLHQLPGRLRIHLPMLRRLNARHQLLVRELVPFLREIEGITEAQASTVTGNLLLGYDEGVIRGKEVLQVITDLGLLLARNRKWLRMAQDNDVSEALEQLGPLIRSALRQRPAIDVSVEFPTDVLA